MLDMYMLTLRPSHDKMELIARSYFLNMHSYPPSETIYIQLAYRLSNSLMCANANRKHSDKITFSFLISLEI